MSIITGVMPAPLAQCVKHRSSNQTLTGSNLAAYPLFIFYLFYFLFLFLFFFFFFFCYHNKFLFFLHSFLFFLFMESI